MKLKIKEYLFYLMFLVSFFLIKLIRVNSINYFYLSTVISIMFFISMLIYMNRKKINIQEFNHFKYIVIIYFIYVLITNILIMPKGIIYTINIIIPIVTIIPIIYFIDSKKKLQNINSFIVYMFLVSSILALIMYMLGYSKIEFSFNTIIQLTPTSEYLQRFNEGRLTWLMSHKSRYALYCLIGIVITLRNMYINKKVKILTLALIYINLILSNTMTSIAMGLILLIIFYYRNIILFIKNTLKKFMNKNIFSYTIYFFLFILLIFLIVMFFNNLDKVRDVSTLGGRLFIWLSSIEFIINNPMGIGSINDEFILTSQYLAYDFTNAHNVFLNEMIERGIISGLLIILIIISMLIIYKKNNKRIYILVNIIFIIGMFMDHTISREMSYIFWYTNAIWCSESILSSREALGG